MTEAPCANLEMAIVLPLGVVANQLMRIEADLRLLNMKALSFAKRRDDIRLAGQLEARLDNINAALDSIRVLVSDIEADIQPRSTGAARTSAKRYALQVRTSSALDDAQSAPDAVHEKFSNRNPQADRDD